MKVVFIFLQPDCEYDVRVKVGESSPEIERAGPTNRRIKVIERLIYILCLLSF